MLTRCEHFSDAPSSFMLTLCPKRMSSYDDTTSSDDDEVGYQVLFGLPLPIATTPLDHLRELATVEDLTTRITRNNLEFRTHLDVLSAMTAFPRPDRRNNNALVLDYLPYIRQMAYEDDKEVSRMSQQQRRGTRNSALYTRAVELTEDQRRSLNSSAIK